MSEPTPHNWNKDKENIENILIDPENTIYATEEQLKEGVEFKEFIVKSSE